MSALNKILIKTKKQVFSEIVGNNPSIFKGEGFDFSEIREYALGDDVRKINWNITAKLQKPYIKIYHETRELNIAIVSLLGGSVYFGTKGFKQETIAEIVSILAFSAVKNQDRFSSYIFSTKLEEAFVKPTKNIHAVSKAVQEILAYPALGKALKSVDLQKTLLSKIKKRSILFLIGDFLDGEYELKLLAKKHDLIAIIVRDRFEEEPAEIGSVTLADPVTFKRIRLSLDTKSVKAYREEIRRRDHELFENFRKSGVAFLKIYSDEEPYSKLRKFFLSR